MRERDERRREILVARVRKRRNREGAAGRGGGGWRVVG